MNRQGLTGPATTDPAKTDPAITDSAATDPATTTARALVDAFIALQESNRGTELAQGLTDYAVLDLNVPQWRFQEGGGPAISKTFAEPYPAGFRTTGCRWEPTPTAAVVEYDSWDVVQDIHDRHLAVPQLHGGRISRLTIYSTGGWDAVTVERQRREAPMVAGDGSTGGVR